MSIQRRRISKDVRKALWERLNRKCGYCGMKIGLPEVTIDHMVPLSRGGADCIDNMICSCKMCNELKRNRTIEEFRGTVSGLTYDLMQESPKYRAAIRFGFVRVYRKKAVFYFEKCENRKRRVGKCRK